LGYDFILDEKLNCYLIEVNTNPCLEESNELLRKLLPRMLDDMLNIVADPIFNHGHLYKDQLAPVQAAQNFPAKGDAKSPQNQERFNALFPTFNPRSVKVPYRSKYKLPGALFDPSHPGYADEVNLWEDIEILD